MTKYEEICESSNNAIKRWGEYRDRCWQYHAAIVNGLVRYCEIPSDNVTFLKSNGLPGEERRYRQPEDRGMYTLPGAVTFEDDEFWHLGFGITLSPKGHFPERWIGGVLCVTEENGQPVVKFGPQGKPQVIDFNNADQCTALYDEIFATLKARFDNPRQITKQKQIGFSVIANPQEGEKQEKAATTAR